MENKIREFIKDFILRNYIMEIHETPIKLRSGRFSHVYFDWGKVMGNRGKLVELTNMIFEFTNAAKLKPDSFLGVPDGMTPLGIIANYRWPEYYHGNIMNQAIVMGRSIEKDHGKDTKNFVCLPGKEVVLIEDVVETGYDLMRFVDLTANLGSRVVGVYSFVDRRKKGLTGVHVSEILNGKQIPYYPFIDAPLLIRDVYSEGLYGKDIGDAIRREYAKTGVERLNFNGI